MGGFSMANWQCHNQMVTLPRHGDFSAENLVFDRCLSAAELPKITKLRIQPQWLCFIVERQTGPLGNNARVNGKIIYKYIIHHYTFPWPR